MRVRHLQSHLQNQNLIHHEHIGKLSNMRMGIDAVFWLRSIQALKDPFADAIGGIPPGIYGFVDKELEWFRKFNIRPLFIFQGMAPPAQHQMYINRMDQQMPMEMAWNYLANGQKNEAQKCFAVSTSRINSDFVYFLFHHLRGKGYECFQSPYFSGAQLAHFAQEGILNAVFGPPGLLLYGVQKVVVHMDFPRHCFEWLDLEHILVKWQIKLPQFVDACMLAGTEYCLTYPFLNIDQYSTGAASTAGDGSTYKPPSAGSEFNFEAAVSIVKNAPLINWLQTFPTEDMRNDHIEGYCACKVLLRHCPVYSIHEKIVKPLSHCQQSSQAGSALGSALGTGSALGGTGSGVGLLGQGLAQAGTAGVSTGGVALAAGENATPSNKDDEEEAIPADFSTIMGEMLPNGLYLLMCEGIITAKLPLALARAEWLDKNPPLVDTTEYRELLNDISCKGGYRSRCLGLLCKNMHAKFMNPVQSRVYYNVMRERGVEINESEPVMIHPELPDIIKWEIGIHNVQAEMQRQGVTAVDFVFCLKWHAHEMETLGHMSVISKDLLDKEHQVKLPSNVDKETIAAYVYFMLLENLEYLSNDGGITVLGTVLKDVSKNFQEPCLVALELMKFGILSGEPLEPANPERPFPSRVAYPSTPTQREKSVFLLTRVLSLIPMRLRNDMWNAEVVFDLAAFHSMIKLLKRTLRQMVEGCIASLLIDDLDMTQRLPETLMCCTTDKNLQVPALLPAFPLPRSCLGIVCKYFLDYEGDDFPSDVQANFSCCHQPVKDLQTGLQFWVELKGCVDSIAEPLGALELKADMDVADIEVRKQCKRYNIEIPQPLTAAPLL